MYGSVAPPVKPSATTATTTVGVPPLFNTLLRHINTSARRDWVRDHLTFHEIGMVSVFETTIRVLGGLLSAFELSREEVRGELIFRSAGQFHFSPASACRGFPCADSEPCVGCYAVGFRHSDRDSAAIISPSVAALVVNLSIQQMVWQVFLERAKDLADRLMPAFGTSTGIPYKLVSCYHSYHAGWLSRA